VLLVRANLGGFATEFVSDLEEQHLANLYLHVILLAAAVLAKFMLFMLTAHAQQPL
jgi:hypothetical protein